MKKTSKIENTVFNPSKNTKLTKGMKSQKRTEANARRKVAKDWAHLSRCSKKYKKAVAREFTSRTTQMMKEELFDGILLNLRCQERGKSYNEQKRILRRIVEKRQAQAAFHHIGRRNSRLFVQTQRTNLSKSMDALRRHQFCA
ncbi:MAG: hypothetical protein MJ143_06280 [Clostridia bacterium]|nr:hypothetical protein [Clostridia bacterium]